MSGKMRIALKAVLWCSGYLNSDSRTNGEEKLHKFISNQNPKVCIDVGAHNGSISNFFLKNSNSLVISFEPAPSSFKDLVEQNDSFRERFIAVNEALSNEIGVADFFYNVDNSELSTLGGQFSEIPYINQTNKEIIKVNINTLDNWFLANPVSMQKIDFIKIDVEGFEYEVIQGALKTIRLFKPNYIQIENNWHNLIIGGRSMFEISKLLPQYKLFQILSHGKILVERDASEPLTNIFQYSNFCFVLEGSLLP